MGVLVEGRTVYRQYFLGNSLRRRVLDELRKVVLQMAYGTVDVQRHLYVSLYQSSDSSELIGLTHIEVVHPEV